MPDSPTQTFEALGKSDVAAIRAVIKIMARTVNSRDDYGNMGSCTQPWTRNRQISISAGHGAGVNAANQNGHAALMWAMLPLPERDSWYSTARRHTGHRAMLLHPALRRDRAAEFFACRKSLRL